MQQAYDQIHESYGSSSQYTLGVDPNNNRTTVEQHEHFDPVQANQQADIPQLQSLRDNAQASISYLMRIVDNYINGVDYDGDTTLEEDLQVARRFFESACGCRSRDK